MARTESSSTVQINSSSNSSNDEMDESEMEKAMAQIKQVEYRRVSRVSENRQLLRRDESNKFSRDDVAQSTNLTKNP